MFVPGEVVSLPLRYIACLHALVLIVALSMILDLQKHTYVKYVCVTYKAWKLFLSC